MSAKDANPMRRFVGWLWAMLSEHPDLPAPSAVGKTDDAVWMNFGEPKNAAAWLERCGVPYDHGVTEAGTQFVSGSMTVHGDIVVGVAGFVDVEP